MSSLHPLLDDLPEDVRDVVLERARRRRFSKGEVLFHEGDTGDTIHLLMSGRVSVHTTSMRGEVSTLNVMGAGGFFGELALLGDPQRSATVVALEPVETLTLRREELAELHPGANAVLLGALAERVRELSAHLAEALHLPVSKRILRRVLDLCAVYEGDPPIEIPMTQDDIASMAGTSRQTANKVLREAVSKGWIELVRGRVVVLDPESLRRRAL